MIASRSAAYSWRVAQCSHRIFATGDARSMIERMNVACPAAMSRYASMLRSGLKAGERLRGRDHHASGTGHEQEGDNKIRRE